MAWFNNDRLYGGETIECNGKRPRLFVAKKDVFRIEKTGRAINMIPHPNNQGGWQHDKTNPVKLIKIHETNRQRVYSLAVTVTGGAQKNFFLVDRADLSIALSLKDPGNGPANGGSVSLRR